MLGCTATGDGGGLKALLMSGDASLTGLRLGIEARRIDLATAGSIACFGGASPAGDTASFTADRDGVAIIAAPGGIMDFETQDTATPLTVLIKRATVKSQVKFEVPDPLADPVLDLHVYTSTAKSFFVKAGDFIQIIDVDGRQCTDFQCFAARKLDRGIEHALDVTTTRTLMLSAYPMPGLHAKYYDQDMIPLVEVVQDTCGRHDAFALACAAKYYDDIGYPGHVNCSDNFNLRWLTMVSPRGLDGWQSISFSTLPLMNMASWAGRTLVAPRDYVLMRALTDLVCVSSACPDDTSPANGWNPTDIHVRTYRGEENFQCAVAFRATPDAEPKMTKETGFHQSFAKHTRHFVEYNGYWLADQFAAAGPVDEYHACRERCVVLDLSPLRKFEITGPDAEALCQYIFTRNVKKMADGQVSYTAMCYPHGGMIDDGTIFRLGRDNFRWIGGSDYGGEWIREQAAELGLKVLVRPQPTNSTMSPSRDRKAVTC